MNTQPNKKATLQKSVSKQTTPSKSKSKKGDLETKKKTFTELAESEDLKGKSLELSTEASAEISEDAREEMEEQAEAAASSEGVGKSGESAALAAAATQGEMSQSFKNFRHHPDMENFYRFIFENDLRLEALTIIDEVLEQKRVKKLVKAQKTLVN